MPRVPQADETRNQFENQVVGNKSDSAIAAVATTASAMAYLKGLLQRTPNCTVTGTPSNTATGNTTLFTITGSIRIVDLIGRVTGTKMAAAQTRLKLQAVVDSLTAVDLCAAADVTNDAIGTVLNITGTVADALVESTNAAQIAQAGGLTIVPTTSAIIRLNNADAANAGKIVWQMRWEPISPGATVTAS